MSSRLTEVDLFAPVEEELDLPSRTVFHNKLCIHELSRVFVCVTCVFVTCMWKGVRSFVCSVKDWTLWFGNTSDL